MERAVSALAASAFLSFVHGAALAESVTPCDLRDAGADVRASNFSAIAELCPMREGLARIRLGKLFGFVNKAGKLVIEPAFTSAGDFSEGAAAVESGGQWTLIGPDGKQAFAPRAGRIGPLRNGLAASEDGGKWGFIDSTGNWRIKPQYDSASGFVGKVALVTSAGRSMLVDRDGKLVRELPAGAKVSWSAKGVGLHTVLSEQPPMLVHRDGRRLPFPEGAVAESFDKGRFVVNRPVKIALDTAQRAGLMGVDGKWLFEPTFRTIGPFRNGIAVARTGPYSLGDYGLINERGQFVAKPIYSEITFDEKTGLYMAKKPQGGDLLDGRAKLLAEGVCGDVERIKGPWLFVQGCTAGYVVHEQRGVVQAYQGFMRAVKGKSHMTVLIQPSDQEEGTLIEVLDNEGKVVLPRTVWTESLRYTQLFTGDRADLPLAVFNTTDDKVAFLNHQLQIVQKPQWEMAYPYSEAPTERAARMTGPLVMETGQGRGAVDMQGTWVVEPKYPSLTIFEHGLAFGTRGGAVYVIDAKGREYPVPKDLFALEVHDANSINAEHGERGPVRFDIKTGAVTARPPEAEAAVETGALLAARKDGLWGLKDAAGKWVVQPTYESRLDEVGGEQPAGWITQAASTEDDTVTLYGWIDAAGKERVRPRYTELKFDEASRLLLASEGERFHGVLALDGSVLMPMSEARITPLKDGWFLLKRDPLHGVLDDAGSWLVGLGADEYVADKDGQLPTARPFAVSTSGDKAMLIDSAGRKSTEAAPQALADGAQASQWWWDPSDESEGRKVRFYSSDFKSRVLLPGVPRAPAFSDGVIAYSLLPRDEEIQTDLAATRPLLGLADSRGRVLGKYPYLSIEPMRDGLALASRAVAATEEQIASAMNSGSVSLDVFHGYLNKAGKTAIGFRFGRAGSFSEGRATVQIDGQLMMIDTGGKTVVQGAWLCGREPVLLDARRNILWPASAKTVTSCPPR